MIKKQIININKQNINEIGNKMRQTKITFQKDEKKNI